MAEFADQQYRLLFKVKLWALFAAGVATVELSVIAFEVAGEDSSALLGTALTLKSLTYVVVPLAMAGIFQHLPRGRFLMSINIVRALSLLSLAFVTGEWSFLVAIAVFLSASAAFSITYLEYVAHLLPDRGDFALAMSKSRIADELEGALSPLVAAVFLVVLPVDAVFLLAAAVLAVSALRIRAARLPDLSGSGSNGRRQRLLRGIRIYISRPELRPLTFLMIAVAAGTAIVMTNTPFLIRSIAGLGTSATALAFGAFGTGAILGALAHLRMPAILRGSSEMVLGGLMITAALLAGTAATLFPAFLALWAIVGAGISLIQMHAAEIIRQIGEDEGLLTAFGGGLAMQNAILSVAYMLAGLLASATGPGLTFAVMGGLSAISVALAWKGLRPGPKPEFSGRGVE